MRAHRGFCRRSVVFGHSLGVDDNGRARWRTGGYHGARGGGETLDATTINSVAAVSSSEVTGLTGKPQSNQPRTNFFPFTFWCWGAAAAAEAAAIEQGAAAERARCRSRIHRCARHGLLA